MINLDKTHLPQAYKNAQMTGKLSEYVCEVAMLKPTCEFFVDKNCITQRWRMKADNSESEHVNEITKVKVRQDGEELGYISVVSEMRNGVSTAVYGVGSFRVNKSRGRHDETTSVHLKVALRNVKKLLIGRDYAELAQLIKNTVEERLNRLMGHAEQRLKWSISTELLSIDYVLLAYAARGHGMDSVVLPANPTKYVRDFKEHEELLKRYIEIKALIDMADNKQGYGLSVYSNGSCAIYDFSDGTVKRYKSTSDLSEATQSRLAMFKVIETDEPHAGFGCKFDQDMYYIVGGELQVQS
jgi:hypothetical protein